jgi:hypothetical protein
MRKNALDAPGLNPFAAEKPRSRWPSIIALLVLGMGLTPIALDAGAWCIGRWKELLGIHADVRTPTLDAIQDALRDTNDELARSVSSYFRYLPWDPSTVLVVAAIVMGASILMLRR